MSRYLLYGHGGCYNHGAEAITSETIKWIRAHDDEAYIMLSTHFKEQDMEFGLDVDQYLEKDHEWFLYDKEHKGKGSYDSNIYKSTFDAIDDQTICMSLGGDNYCYDSWHRFANIHRHAKLKGAKSLLLGCSLDPEYLNDEMIEVLGSHDLITVRESMSLELLKSKGLDNVVLTVDRAFNLEQDQGKSVKEEEYGVVNLSPLVVRREKTEGITLENVDYLIDRMVNQHNLDVVLVPHVLMPADNDIDCLTQIYERCEDKSRVTLISDNMTASKYKKLLANSQINICARTHASIASYSSEVPTLAIGYSMKASGIARDLGVYEHMIPYSSLYKRSDLYDKFLSLYERRNQVIHQLSTALDDLMARQKAADKICLNIISNNL